MTRRVEKMKHNISLRDMPDKLSDWPAWIDKQLQDYGHDATVSVDSWPDGESLYFTSYRDETSKEEEFRLKLAAKEKSDAIKREAAKEKAERKEYERLHKKYGS
jgi:hypothetical protein